MHDRFYGSKRKSDVERSCVDLANYSKYWACLDADNGCPAGITRLWGEDNSLGFDVHTAGLSPQRSLRGIADKDQGNLCEVGIFSQHEITISAKQLRLKHQKKFRIKVLHCLKSLSSAKCSPRRNNTDSKEII